MTTPVRVEFELRTPLVVYPGSKTLDALWSWAAVERAKFNNDEASWEHQHEHGIARHHVGDQWCPMASELSITWACESQPLHYIKRQKLEAYTQAWADGILKKKPAFDSARGATKAGSYFVSTRWVKSIAAWALVDDLPTFEGLLPWITHIGKLRHKDFGAVRSAQAVIDEEAHIRWANRPLPIGSEHATAEHVASMGSLTSPYWLRTSFRPILMPTS